ncbi:hypothetical protein E3E12_02095 [Formicincola oecophyllae]|uniref:Uncharacterized protein n=1 Tax=Formicincola oecophyllae TaxID=2558361 RepID=A0A4Y6U9R2_9PROT|nr:hypothetical protein [Formicincola oecophyllae]QDH13186.1 hypothetical protein E3E12_02095 [Formicincola oecophyllae]
MADATDTSLTDEGSATTEGDGAADPIFKLIGFETRVCRASRLLASLYPDARCADYASSVINGLFDRTFGRFRGDAMPAIKHARRIALALGDDVSNATAEARMTPEHGLRLILGIMTLDDFLRFAHDHPDSSVAEIFPSAIGSQDISPDICDAIAARNMAVAPYLDIAADRAATEILRLDRQAEAAAHIIAKAGLAPHDVQVQINDRHTPFALCVHAGDISCYLGPVPVSLTPEAAIARASGTIETVLWPLVQKRDAAAKEAQALAAREKGQASAPKSASTNPTGK